MELNFIHEIYRKLITINYNIALKLNFVEFNQS